MSDAVPVDLADLIEAHLNDRSRADLARAAGVKSSNTVKNWATGATPLPRYKAVAIAEWLGDDVTAEDVIAAAAASRRAYDDSQGVGGTGQAAVIARAGGRGKGLMADERAEIVGALASIGQQLLDLAKRIEQVGDDD